MDATQGGSQADGQHVQTTQDTLHQVILTRRTVARLALGVGSLALSKKFSLAGRFVATVAQVIAFIVVLSLTTHQHCDKPLQTFLALHLTRVALSFPLKFYTTLAPPRRNNDTTAPPPVRVIGNERLDSRIRFLGDLCSLAALVIFLIGNYWFFSTETCRQTSPTLFWATLTALLFGYLYVAELVLIALGVIFFLPLMIIAIRFFGLYEKKPSVGPLDQAMIDKIPLVLYKPMVVAQDNIQPEEQTDGLTYPPPPPVPSTPVPIATSKSKGLLLRLLQGRKKRRPKSKEDIEGGANQPPHPFHEISEGQATCSICLLDYEPVNETTTEFEPLRLLQCKHAFHQACLDPWLTVSGRCPICQKEVFPGTTSKRRIQLPNRLQSPSSSATAE